MPESFAASVWDFPSGLGELEWGFLRRRSLLEGGPAPAPTTVVQGPRLGALLTAPWGVGCVLEAGHGHAGLGAPHALPPQPAVGGCGFGIEGLNSFVLVWFLIGCSHRIRVTL